MPRSPPTITVDGLDGQPFAMEQLEGKVVLFVNTASNVDSRVNTKAWSNCGNPIKQTTQRDFVIVGAIK